MSDTSLTGFLDACTVMQAKKLVPGSMFLSTDWYQEKTRTTPMLCIARKQGFDDSGNPLLKITALSRSGLYQVTLYPERNIFVVARDT